MARVAAGLDAITGTARVRVVDAAQPGKAVVRADIAPDAVGDVLDELERLAVPRVMFRWRALSSSGGSRDARPTRASRGPTCWVWPALMRGRGAVPRVHGRCRRHRVLRRHRSHSAAAGR